LNPGCIAWRIQGGILEISASQFERERIQQNFNHGQFDNLGILRAEVLDNPPSPDRQTEIYRSEISRTTAAPEYKEFPRPIVERVTVICPRQCIHELEELVPLAKQWVGPETEDIEEARLFVCVNSITGPKGLVPGIYAQTNFRQKGERYSWKLFTNESFDLEELFLNLAFTEGEISEASPEFITFVKKLHTQNVSYLIERGLFNSSGTSIYVALSGATKWAGVNAFKR
jgi:hypothetical protein